MDEKERKKIKKNKKFLKSISYENGEMASNELTNKKKNSNKNKINSLRTPKAALLERRRNAVLDLLKEEIYPTGKLN
jgi:hypothetical protein